MSPVQSYRRNRYAVCCCCIPDTLEVPEVVIASPPYCEFVAAIDPDDFDFRMQVTQNRDPTIVELRIKLEKEEMINFVIKNDRRSNNDVNLLYVRTYLLFVRTYILYEEMRTINILPMMHERVGHQSVDKIEMHYWFPRMNSKVEKFIKNCVKCIIYAAQYEIQNETSTVFQLSHFHLTPFIWINLGQRGNICC